MIFNDIAHAAYSVTELMEDVWKSRDNIMRDELDNIYMVYNLTVGEKDIFIHFVIESVRWYVTVNDVPDYKMNFDDLFFRDPDIIDCRYRVESCDHYAFGDLVQEIIKRELIAMKSADSETAHLRNTFPIVSVHY